MFQNYQCFTYGWSGPVDMICPDGGSMVHCHHGQRTAVQSQSADLPFFSGSAVLGDNQVPKCSLNVLLFQYFILLQDFVQQIRKQNKRSDMPHPKGKLTTPGELTPTLLLALTHCFCLGCHLRLPSFKMLLNKIKKILC